MRAGPDASCLRSHSSKPPWEPSVTVALRAQFFQISTVEWTVLAPVCVAMVGLSMLVAYLSARTWVKIDPMEAVRHA